METLVPWICLIGIIVALVYRIVEEDRKEAKIQRMLNRTNSSAWKRSKKLLKRR